MEYRITTCNGFYRVEHSRDGLGWGGSVDPNLLYQGMEGLWAAQQLMERLIAAQGVWEPTAFKMVEAPE